MVDTDRVVVVVGGTEGDPLEETGDVRVDCAVLVVVGFIVVDEITSRLVVVVEDDVGPVEAVVVVVDGGLPVDVVSRVVVVVVVAGEQCW